jgi:putative transposase
MPAKKYRVDLTAPERETLLGLIRAGKTAARQVTRARILLKAEEGLSDEEIAEEVATSRVTVERTRQRFVEESLGALTERPRTGAPPRLTGKGEAHLIAVTCSPAPAGRERWTLRLLADEAVALGLADSLSRETVRQLLKKTTSNPGNISNGVSPQLVPSLSRKWKRSSTSTLSPTIPSARKSTSMRRVNS